jgi:hypothetical protein
MIKEAIRIRKEVSEINKEELIFWRITDLVLVLLTVSVVLSDVRKKTSRCFNLSFEQTTSSVLVYSKTKV